MPEKDISLTAPRMYGDSSCEKQAPLTPSVGAYLQARPFAERALAAVTILM